MYKEATIDIERALSTSLRDGEVKYTKAKGKSSSHGFGINFGLKSFSAVYNFARGKTSSNQYETKIYTCSISTTEIDGRASWIFQVDDPKRQIEGEELRDHKLPRVKFQFLDSQGPPQDFEVQVASFWKAARNHSSDIGYSNVCQRGKLRVSYNITKRAHQKAIQYAWEDDTNKEEAVRNGTITLTPILETEKESKKPNKFKRIISKVKGWFQSK
ncbi:hypothetical protein BDQ17DRAFT_464729 [Cyathus striatus]|nr:hypothetical protein BDQ17DRAFT_464729 [Cyathus striatus]